MAHSTLISALTSALLLAAVAVPGSALAASNDTRTIEEDNFPVIVDVLQNDDQPNIVPNTSQIQSVTQPMHGTTSINQDMYDQISYSANPDYCGPDTFTYTGDYGTATVSMTVTCEDDAADREQRSADRRLPRRRGFRRGRLRRARERHGRGRGTEADHGDHAASVRLGESGGGKIRYTPTATSAAATTWATR